MTFTSLDFAVFLPLVFLIHWFATSRTLTSQNILIVIASAVFYGWWDWRFLFLILFSTVLDFALGYAIFKSDNKRKRRLLLYSSVVLNLGLLGFFKYFNFFIENFKTAFSFFGMELEWGMLDIILPVGISFYTFQTLSYTIDIYRNKIEPTKDLLAFASYVCFFPQLVAGPIERARDMLPQFQVKRTFDYKNAVDGTRQILWGLFKKIVIADNCAEYANLIFNNSSDYAGSTLVLGGVFFTIQIYADFSGYSDIAIGTARLFGVRLSKNFNFPFFAQTLPELWRKWHMTLTLWLNEAVFIPLNLAFRDYGKAGMILAFLIYFGLIGLWHGANWTFIVFGLVHGVLFIPYIIRGTVGKKKRRAIGLAFPLPKEAMNMTITFTVFMLTCIIFRAENMQHTWSYFSNMFSSSLFSLPRFQNASESLVTILFCVIFVIIEWIGREDAYALEKIGLNWKRPLRYTFYYSVVLCIFWFGGKEQDFIYFQF